MMIALLASVGYGAVFLIAGLFFRNPVIPAAVVWVWENLNPFLPGFLKKISVIFYLKGLAPKFTRSAAASLVPGSRYGPDPRSNRHCRPAAGVVGGANVRGLRRAKSRNRYSE
jgi:hypothetical protein